MNKRSTSLGRALFFILLAVCAYSIEAQESYYKKGRATIKNVKIVNVEGSNPHYRFTIVNKDKAQRWTPEQVDEYKKEFGNRFVSREVDPGHFAFLEELESGTLSVFYLNDRNHSSRFFLKRIDGTFIEMTNDRRKSSYFQKVLKAEWTATCDRLDRFIAETTYTKASMSRIVKSHNTCKRIITPQKRHIIAGGAGWTKYIVANSRNVKSAVPVGGLHRGEYNRTPSYFLSYRMEVPVQSSNTSVVTGVRFHKLNMDYFNLFGFGEVTFRVEANTMDLGIPLGLIQNQLIGNLKTFFSFELIPSYQVLSDVLVTFSVSEPGGILKISTSDFSTSNFAVNGNAAIGFKVPYKGDKELSFRLGYDLRMGTGNSRLFNVSSIYATFGYGL